MKTNKSIKLISSLLIFIIIFSLTISVSVGCKEEISTETGTPTVTGSEADIASYTFMVATFIMVAAEEIKNEKAQAKAAQEYAEEGKAKAKAFLEAVKAEYEAQNDFREDLLNTILYGPGGSEVIDFNKQLSFIMRKLVEAGADAEQNTPVTTVPQKQEKKGNITLTGSIESGFSLSPLILVIDLDTGVVTGTFTGVYEYEGFESEFYTDPADTANGVADLSGAVELETGAITGAGALEYTWQNAGTGETWPFAVEGTLSEDYKSAEGEFLFSDGSWPWTATAQ